MARRRKGRNVHGILLLNKPTGMTSNKILQKVKHLYNANKAGHTGSLDPLATGLLPLCLGEATKVSHFLLDVDKRYVAECHLGVTTITADSEGEILQERPIDGVSTEQIEQVVQQFIGEQMQLPPMYSALKHQGQPLYKLARKGQTVEREARPITIFDIKIIDISLPKIVIDVHCSKGTYIRTLAEDIGEALGCGAHISALHRSEVGHYQDMIDFDTLQEIATQGFEALDELLIPIDTALPHLPALHLTDELSFYIRQGQAVQAPQAPTEGLIKLFTAEQTFIGIGHVLEDGRIAPKRLMNL
ncbi:tRNA pseudouridine(55) synthase TruB [Candidatus Albibeggiatoa sp. nov. NOAA]|uniref:tRNA pseudouridine(55) synthase TruB n=1 Tax=Candidatus Albibeggiatoa sp. nov. NOAA TaxID=3162724 RepID=UPI003301B2B0|nr:tRNA pseudouridine(55) synthase TruB [Thiotrichaceae bacterium]